MHKIPSKQVSFLITGTKYASLEENPDKSYKKTSDEEDSSSTCQNLG